MSLIATANRLNAANQLTNWNQQAISLINQALSHLNSIKTQKISMESNSDFTPEDILEVEEMIANIHAAAEILSV